MKVFKIIGSAVLLCIVIVFMWLFANKKLLQTVYDLNSKVDSIMIINAYLEAKNDSSTIFIWRVTTRNELLERVYDNTMEQQFNFDTINNYNKEREIEQQGLGYGSNSNKKLGYGISKEIDKW